MLRATAQHCHKPQEGREEQYGSMDAIRRGKDDDDEQQ
jgi:hypothetical protein